MGLLLFPLDAEGKERQIVQLSIEDSEGVMEDFNSLLLLSQKGTLVDSLFVAADKKSLRDHLVEKGYFFARIEVRRKEGTGGTELKFVIYPGPRVRFSGLKTRGNRHFSREALEEVFQKFLFSPPYPFYHPGRWFGITSSPVYGPSQIKKALSGLESHYRSEGFWEVTIKADPVEFSSSKEEAVLPVKIAEGPRFRWGKVYCQGPEDLQKAFLSLSGKAFSQKAFLGLVKTFQQKWRQGGYFHGSIRYRFLPQKKERLILLRVEARRGPVTRVGEIYFFHHHTKDSFLRQYLEVQPGEILTEKKWKKSLGRLKGTGLFEKVKFSLEKSLFPELYDLKIEVQESSDGKVQLLGGYSSEFGLFGGGAFEIKNFDIFRWPASLLDWRGAFRGGGQRLQIQTLWGEMASNSRVLFFEPFLGGTPVTFQSQVFYRRWKYSSYEETRWGTEGLLGRTLGPFQLQVGYRWERLYVDPSKAPVPPEVTELNKGLRIGTFLFIPQLFGKVGEGAFSLSLKTEGGHTSFGGDTDFFKLTVPLNLKIPLLKRVFLKGELQGGWGRQFDGSDLPYPLRFFLGGHSTLRGFAFWKVGTQVGDFPLGGSAFWAGRMEVHVPLWKWIWAVGFTDLGDLGADLKIFRQGSLRLSVGGGLRFYLLSTRIPLALDFGVPLINRTEDERELVSFAMELNF